MARTARQKPATPGPGRGVKRAAVLRAARALFLEHGFAGTSVDAVTAAAGVSKPTVYSYFPTKDALFDAVVRDGGPGPWAPAGFAVTGDPRGDLEQAARAVADVPPDAVAWDRMVSAEAGRRPDLARLHFDRGPGRVLQLLADLFRALDGMGGLAVGDADRAAEFFLGMAAGVPLLRGRLCVGSTPGVRTAQIGCELADRFLRAYSPYHPEVGSLGDSTEQPETTPSSGA